MGLLLAVRILYLFRTGTPRAEIMDAYRLSKCQLERVLTGRTYKDASVIADAHLRLNTTKES